jgi:hypothetical protein
MSQQDATAVAITGGTMAAVTVGGKVIGNNSEGSRTITTTAAVGGAAGDVWYRY